MKKKKTFRRHFRIYFKNNHPAYIVDEEGNLYVFHRVTHSKSSGGRKNWEIKNNPIVGFLKKEWTFPENMDQDLMWERMNNDIGMVLQNIFK